MTFQTDHKVWVFRISSCAAFRKGWSLRIFRGLWASWAYSLAEWKFTFVKIAQEAGEFINPTPNSNVRQKLFYMQLEQDLFNHTTFHFNASGWILSFLNLRYSWYLATVMHVTYFSSDFFCIFSVIFAKLLSTIEIKHFSCFTHDPVVEV